MCMKVVQCRSIFTQSLSKQQSKSSTLQVILLCVIEYDPCSFEASSHFSKPRANKSLLCTYTTSYTTRNRQLVDEMVRSAEIIKNKMA